MKGDESNAGPVRQIVWGDKVTSTLTRAVSAVAAASVLGLVVVAQQGGQPRPRPPITPHAYPLDDEHYLRWPLPAAEQAYGRIDGRTRKQYVVDITAVSRHPLPS